MNFKIVTAFSLALAILLSGMSHPESISRMMANAVKSSDDLNIPSFLNKETAKKGQYKKSKFLALGLSMLLPGAGQYYTEDKTKMIIFGGTEAAIWAGFIGLRTYGSWKKNDYKAWAVYHAGADVNGKPEIYFEKLTFYDNINEYNQLARVIDGPDAYLFPSTPSYYWNWDNDISRAHYRTLRNQSKGAYRKSLYFLGGAVINRLLSGIDAYRSAVNYERGNEFGQAKWRLYYSGDGLLENGAVEFGVAMRF